MKTIPTDLGLHLLKEVTTLAYCWKLTYADATVFGFTSHDQDILFESVNYKSKTGFTLDQYKSELLDKSDQIEIFGIVDSTDIGDDDIRSGRLDNAALEVFIVNYESPANGRVLIKKGKIAQISRSQGSYQIAITGIADNLDRNITEIYSPLCKARFGDNRCGVNISSLTLTGGVTEIVNDKIFKDSSRTEAKGYFDKGVIKFTSGNNSGFSSEVRRSETEKITLSIPLPSPILVGDDYQISAGCDKKFTTCISKYNNALNFRGEPHIPGINEIFKVN